MEVLTDSDSSPVLISNAEVLKLLKEKLAERQENEKKQRKHVTKYAHRDWIEEKVFAYLQTTPCIHMDPSKLSELTSKLTSSKRLSHGTSPSSPSTAATEENAAIKTTGFGLTGAEALQIVNFMPTEPVEIHLMVEELHSRMSESRQEELLQLVASYRQDGNNTEAGEVGVEADAPQDDHALIDDNIKNEL